MTTIQVKTSAILAAIIAGLVGLGSFLLPLRGVNATFTAIGLHMTLALSLTYAILHIEVVILF